MTQQPAIRVSGVSKCYPMYEKPHHRLKQMVLGRFGHSYARPFWALHDVSLEVAKGEAVGIVGRNGSGKSTLLQIISGILQPTEGTVEVNGRVAALLELGAGFNPDFTGRENVYMNGSILGLTHEEMDQRIDAIESFAGIGDFIDQPVKSYSSGMMVRLAFSVQVQIEPDVLIVDEALAVGDALFQKRCYQRMEQLIERGTTLLFVSHDQESVRTLTSRALLLNQGRASCLGTSAEVLLAYRKQLHEAEQEQLAAATEEWGQEALAQEEGHRSGNLEFGDREVEVLEAQVLDENGGPTQVLYPGDRFVFAITCRVHREATHLNVAFRLRNKQGIKITSWGTLNEQIRKHALEKPTDGLWDRRFNPGEVFTVQFEGTCTLGPNFYEIQATVTEEPSLDYVNQRILHWQDEAAFFTVHPRIDEYVFGGICDLGLTSRVEVQKPDAAAT